MQPISKKILLHIGAPKCGSSSIQKTLTFNPTFGYKGGGPGPINYWLIQNGVASRSPIVKTLAVGQDYLASNHLLWRDLDRPCVHKCLQDLITKMESNEVAIVSGESFGYAFLEIVENFGVKCDCAKSKDLEITVVMFIRDIFSLTESAYFQWGLWSTPTLEKWVEGGGLTISFFHGAAAQSAFQLGCDNLVIHHLEQGSLLDPFYTVLQRWGYLKNHFEMMNLLTSNSRASLDDIRLQQRNVGLREIHDPRTEFFLNQLRSEGNLPNAKAPNLLTESIVSTIVIRLSKDRELLQTFCSEETNEILFREFSEEHLMSLNYCDPGNNPYETLREPPNIDYLEKLSVLLIKKFYDERSFAAASEMHLGELNQAVAERNQAVAEKEMILNSRIWKFTSIWRRFR
ncbi:MAG: hypothetical protein F2786_02770 [Actinobacteria bacterium]|uniref:Unannotated protein n=1 Tax=freshwater metagenome TaxID=449393 RepID=A0A6J7CWM0_9ZZZZ|nr:hypothetical protein [Actinomycetota bacterium]